MNTHAYFKMFLVYFNINKIAVTGIIIDAFIQAAFAIGLALASGYIFNNYSFSTFYFLVAGLFIGFGIRFISDLINKRLHAQLTTQIIATIRKSLADNLKNITFHFNKRSTEEMSQSRIFKTFTEDVSIVELFLSNSFVPMIKASVNFLISFIVLIFLFWQIAVILALVMVFIFLIPFYFQSKTNVSNAEHKLSENALLLQVQEIISAHIVVTTYNVWPHFSTKVLSKIKQSSETGTLHSKRIYGIQIFMLNMLLFYQILIGSLGGMAIAWGMISVGLIFSLMMLTQYINAALVNFLKNLPLYFKMVDSLKHITQLTQLKPLIVYKPDAINLSEIKHSVAFKNVSYGYDLQSKILHDLSFHIKMGQSVAFVGPSGSGKSTILKLLMRFLDTSSGEIVFDKQYPITDISENSLRNHMAIVMQDSMLFNMSLYDNIAIGKLNATEEEVFNAARQAGIHNEIMELPLGYKTYIEENGSLLSGGQRQRLALARGLIRKASLLLLDEVTSGVDSITEAEINSSLLEYAKHRTLIIATHRLSIVSQLDYIYVLRQGHLVEEGSHENLLSQNGFYAQSWLKQNSIVLTDLRKISHIDTAYLQSIALFKNWTKEQLDALSESFAVEAFEADELIFEQHTFGDKLYIIASGEVELFTKRNEALAFQARKILVEGDYFGETALFSSVLREVSAITLSSATFLTLTRAQFEKYKDNL